MLLVGTSELKSEGTSADYSLVQKNYRTEGTLRICLLFRTFYSKRANRALKHKELLKGKKGRRTEAKESDTSTTWPRYEYHAINDFTHYTA